MHTAHSTQHVARGLRSAGGKRAWPCIRRIGCLLSAVSYLLLSGCIHRSLTIRTDPPGALVYVNDQLKGESPVTYDFVWYGWYRVLLRKDGYERLDDHKFLRAPVYLWMPFDFFMELLPVPVRDARTWSYTLSPVRELPTPVPPQTPAPTSAPEETPHATR